MENGLQKLQSDIDLANFTTIGGGSFGTVFKVQLNSPNPQHIPIPIPNVDYFALKMTIMDTQEEMEHENEGRAYREITKLRDGKHIVQQYLEYSVCSLMDEIGSFVIGDKTLDSWCATDTEGSSTASRPEGRKTANEKGFFKFFLMELCVRSLHDYMENAKPDEESEGMGVIDHQEISRIFTHVATGLVELHRKGVIHRDIKPRNILQGSDGNWKIGDFGLCTLDPTKTEGSTVPFDLTMSKSRRKSLGTPIYKAPEIGNLVDEFYSQKVDVFSLGQTYIDLILSHENEDSRGIMLDIIHGEKRASAAYGRVGRFFNKCAMSRKHLEFVKLVTNRWPAERPSSYGALEIFCNTGNDFSSLTDDQAPLVREQVQEALSSLYCCCQITTAAKIYGWMDIFLSTVVCIIVTAGFSSGVSDNDSRTTAQERTMCIIVVTVSVVGWILIVGAAGILIYGVSHKRPKWCLPHMVCRAVLITAGSIGPFVALVINPVSWFVIVLSCIAVLIVMGFLGYQMKTVIRCYKYLKNCAEPQGSVIEHYSPALTASAAYLDNRDEARNANEHASYESHGESNSTNGNANSV